MNPAPSKYSSRTFGYIQKIIRMNVSKVRDSNVFKMCQIKPIIKNSLNRIKALNKKEGAG